MRRANTPWAPARFAAFSRGLGHATSGDEVLSSLAIWVQSMVPCDRASVTFPDSDHSLRIHAFQGDGVIDTTDRLPIEGTTVGRSFRSGEVICLEDTASSSDLDTVKMLRAGIRSVVVVPLRVAGRTIGTLNLGRRGIGAFDSEEISALGLIAVTAGAHLSVHELVRTRTDLGEHQRVSRGMARIVHLANRLAEAKDEDEICRNAADLLPGVVTADRCSIAILEADAPSFLLRAISGRDDERVPRRVPLPGSLVEECAARRSHVVCDDLESRRSAGAEALRNLGIRSAVCVPLFIGSDFVGTLNAGRSVRTPFDETEILLLKHIALTVAQAMMSVRTRTTLHRAQVEAESANRAKTAFLAMITHELRTPLNGVIGMTRVLRSTSLGRRDLS
ncbi:MAG: GAF domain-containing protein [Candidatus Eisenbacteria bacterium]|uniref:histidine kinase n=1 Tax=Eiseniibacteriota bacterium TaxID=2212470 RepID=A0A956LZ13_UNCEI|nr:GAF domain-containing protein [Candidatus Eisenbacteria bacterium]